MREPGGFTLVEAAVAVAVVSILAGMAAPLAVRILDRRKEEATRECLKLAFECMFGSPSRRVRNMRADFGFPTAPLPGHAAAGVPIPLLVAHGGAIPATHDRHDGASFYWGYNGPYWLGPVADGSPADAWGNPILLKCVVNPATEVTTWQVMSRGTGRPTDEPLVYPPTPAGADSYRATILVTVDRLNPGGTVQVRYPVPDRRDLGTTAEVEVRGAALPPFRVPSGSSELIYRPPKGSPPGSPTLVFPLDLLPGEVREVMVKVPFPEVK